MIERVERQPTNSYSYCYNESYCLTMDTIDITLPEKKDTLQIGCPVNLLKGKLRCAGLRPTRQRVALGWMLFGKGDRHVSAEALHEEAAKARIPVSLATVYNTLHQFKEAGLLRQVAMDGSKAYFDTNTSDHHHFFIEGEDRMMDIPGPALGVTSLPQPPKGMEIARIDVIIRLRKKL
jgi:Fur family transcriptional regulator, iron response regulator